MPNLTVYHYDAFSSIPNKGNPAEVVLNGEQLSEEQMLEGQGLVQMGDTKENLDVQAPAQEGYAIMVPAGTWHNVTNTGDKPLKVYVIYAPPQHPFGTVHPTKADAMATEK